MQKLVITKPSGDTLTSQGVKLNPGGSIVVKGLSGAEIASINILVGTEFDTVSDASGAEVELTATKKSLTINASGTYQVDIGATTNDITVAFNAYID